MYKSLTNSSFYCLSQLLCIPLLAYELTVLALTILTINHDYLSSYSAVLLKVRNNKLSFMLIIDGYLDKRLKS